MFSGIGSPSALGVRRDERECWNCSVNTKFQDDLSMEAIDDPMMRIYFQLVSQN